MLRKLSFIIGAVVLAPICGANAQTGGPRFNRVPAGGFGRAAPVVAFYSGRTSVGPRIAAPTSSLGPFVAANFRSGGAFNNAPAIPYTGTLSVGTLRAPIYNGILSRSAVSPNRGTLPPTVVAPRPSPFARGFGGRTSARFTRGVTNPLPPRRAPVIWVRRGTVGRRR